MSKVTKLSLRFLANQKKRKTELVYWYSSEKNTCQYFPAEATLSLVPNSERNLWFVVTCGQGWWPGRVGDGMRSWIILLTNAGSLHNIFSGHSKWKVKVWHKIWLRGDSSTDGPEKTDSSKQLSADALWSEKKSWSDISQRPSQRPHISKTRECLSKPHVLQFYRVAVFGDESGNL